MNITYLIGNGFDIACGLKTRYVDFIQTYLTSDNDDKDIREFKSNIEQDLCTWADAEYAFGALTEKIVNVKKFRKYFRDFLYHLNVYFQEQQSKVRYADIKKAETATFKIGLKDYQSFLSDEAKREISDCTNCLDHSSLNFNFLVFNYTEVFERLLRKSIPSKTSELGVAVSNGSPCRCRLESVEYAHGSLKSLPLIFGVNDPEQIRYLIHRRNPDIEQILVKPVGNRETRSFAFERCKSMIHQSDIVCIFGMSIGATDALWWNEILTLLSNNKKANLLIHYWDPECNVAIAGDVIQTTRECKNKLITNAKSDIRMQRSLCDRIHVIINRNPFHISMHV
jgi:hypothetical protein